MVAAEEGHGLRGFREALIDAGLTALALDDQAAVEQILAAVLALDIAALEPWPVGAAYMVGMRFD